MFHSARLRLTAWYLLIIMLISGFFSLVIYGGVTFELERRFNRMEHRLRMEGRGLRLPPGPPPFFTEDLEAAKKRLLVILLSTNGVILVLSATAGYFLAGKTLRPIEETMKEQKRFVTDASHEMRTPLTALKTSIEVALRDKKMATKEARKVLKSSLEEINSLQLLTSGLLSLAQYQKSSSNYDFERVNLKEVVENAYKKVDLVAKMKNIDMKLELENTALEANEIDLEKMVVILLDNAVKYTPKEGRVTVTAKSDRRHILLEVKDTGIGIAKEEIPHIFDRFYRAEQSRSKAKVFGFGLGLSIAKKIVNLHKGSIKASSVIDKGTTFTVRLPLKYS